MPTRKRSERCILITGTSHTGKSTLARRLSQQLGWKVISTDQLARHPGRPWPQPRLQVAEYYTKLTPQTTFWFLKVHHENMWPQLEGMIGTVAEKGQGLVMEGCALRPELMARLNTPDCLRVCLHDDPAELSARIHWASAYETRPPDIRACIDAFVERSLLDNEAQVEAARAHQIQLIRTTDSEAVDLFCQSVTDAWKVTSATAP